MLFIGKAAGQWSRRLMRMMLQECPAFPFNKKQKDKKEVKDMVDLSNQTIEQLFFNQIKALTLRDVTGQRR